MGFPEPSEKELWIGPSPDPVDGGHKLPIILGLPSVSPGRVEAHQEPECLVPVSKIVEVGVGVFPEAFDVCFGNVIEGWQLGIPTEPMFVGGHEPRVRIPDGHRYVWEDHTDMTGNYS
jgi:hypothetical protein